MEFIIIVWDKDVPRGASFFIEATTYGSEQQHKLFGRNNPER